MAWSGLGEQVSVHIPPGHQASMPRCHSQSLRAASFSFPKSAHHSSDDILHAGYTCPYENGSSTEQGLCLVTLVSSSATVPGRCRVRVMLWNEWVDGGSASSASECFSFHLPFTDDLKNDKAVRFGVNVNIWLRLKCLAALYRAPGSCQAQQDSGTVGFRWTLCDGIPAPGEGGEMEKNMSHVSG